METLDICVMGLGYIGLPTASLLATRRHRVRGVDVRAEVVSTINEGNIHIGEPQLDVLVRSAVHSGHLTAATTPAEADVFFITVPTPFSAAFEPDLSFVDAATAALAPFLRAQNLVVLESTSPVGTTERVAENLARLRPDLVRNGVLTVHVAHCPERVLPGHILRELVENDRIVGGVNPASTRRAAEVYRTFVTGNILQTDCRTAELCKLVENSYRDVNIAFANELSMICDELKIDVWELISLANRHPRVNILQPGPGVGGHCLAVDPWFIVSAAPEISPLIRAGRAVNSRKRDHVVEHILERAGRFRSPVIAMLGLAYKANIDDLRESPALSIAREVTERVSGTVLAVEPNVAEVDGLSLTSLHEALERADIVVVLVAHRQFLNIDPVRLRDKVVIDTVGVAR